MTSSIFPNRLEGFWEPDNDRKFTLTSDFIYDDPEKDIRIVVPTGFTTDWNSVPRAFWGYFPPWQYPEAGLIHDWLYKSPNAFGSQFRTSPLDRGACDDIHRRIMDLKGARWTKRQIAWSLLRSFGGVAWDRHRAADVPTGV